VSQDAAQTVAPRHALRLVDQEAVDRARGVDSAGAITAAQEVRSAWETVSLGSPSHVFSAGIPDLEHMASEGDAMRILNTWAAVRPPGHPLSLSADGEQRLRAG